MNEYEQARQELIDTIGHEKFSEWTSCFYGDVNVSDMREALAYAKHEQKALENIWN